MIDFLSLDVEGAELNVLVNFPFHRYTFRAIVLEHNYEEPKRSQLRDLLVSHGYYHQGGYLSDDAYTWSGGKPLQRRTNTTDDNMDNGTDDYQARAETWGRAACAPRPPQGGDSREGDAVDKEALTAAHSCWLARSFDFSTAPDEPNLQGWPA